MKKRLMPVWAVLFSLAAVVLMSARVRSAETLTDGTSAQATLDGTLDSAKEQVQTAVDDGKTAVNNAAGPAQQAMPMQGQGGGEKGGCCG